jgi:Holliday junction resolvase
MSSRGIERERQVRRYLEDRDYMVVRAAGSLGCADLIALRAYSPTLIVEVKSTHRGPFHSFGPADRADILAYAERAGATAVLAYWPPRGKLRFIYEKDWPKTKVTVTPFDPEANALALLEELSS